jgi:hypothetical protein
MREKNHEAESKKKVTFNNNTQLGNLSRKDLKNVYD